MDTYCIKRFFFKGDNEIIAEGLTLEEAQEHCKDPETSSRTCSEPGDNVPWFDGYEKE